MDSLNRLPGDAARVQLTGACASARWAAAVCDQRPFRDADDLLAGAERAFASLSREDWLEAFAAHARLGELRPSDSQGGAEQAGAAGATPAERAELRAGNDAYEKRFGHVFLVRASGLDAGQMLTALHARLANSPATELRLAADQQKEITKLRLRKMLET